MKTWVAESMMLIACVIWGCAFAVMKDALDAIMPNYILAFRFTIAAVLMVIFMWKKLGGIPAREWLAGLVVGALMYGAYLLQTVGLQYTTAGKNAFLTAVYVVLVPFMLWGVRHIRPDKFNMIAAVLCLLGIGTLSLDGGFSINIGDALTLLGGIFYGLHIVAVSFFTEKYDVMRLTWMQFFFTAIFAWGGGLLFETFPAQWSTGSTLSIAYLGVLATLMALTMMNVSIKYVQPSHASLLMSTEAFFGCIAGILFLGEPLSWRIVLGGLLILAAMIVSETKLSFLGKRAAMPSREDSQQSG